MRLIDADALIEHNGLKNAQKHGGDGSGYDMTLNYDILAMIENEPAVDAVPVVHAHWKYVRQYDYDLKVCRCSHCGYEYQMLYDEKSHQFVGDNFCSYCGAKMDEVEYE